MEYLSFSEKKRGEMDGGGERAEVGEGTERRGVKEGKLCSIW